MKDQAWGEKGASERGTSSAEPLSMSNAFYRLEGGGMCRGRGRSPASRDDSFLRGVRKQLSKVGMTEIFGE